MSTLIGNTVTQAGIEQEIHLQFNTSLYAIRVNLMQYNTPTGNLILEIKQGSTVVRTIATAFSVLNDVSGEDYAYGYYRFELDMPLKKIGEYTEYTIKLSSSVAYDEDNYYMWCRDWVKDHDNLYSGNQTDGHADSDTVKPFMFELEEYK